ncbi:MJ0042 family finger-like domain-containing protein [Natronincola peptidivorans]|uniref:MJ0042 family finger-like domain-containing protein n=1 Tax=Natronincola peptidivorans TaxID=426128 RepID=A0A1H9YR17_9FIRM|nr:CD1247 N-terminal domain-containing protein [Natronincola peptidivorans]SES71100.1 MJ0042 family finger-like domain-containing protein [Natronincola peptidivorans]
MNHLFERVAYLKGLADGLNIEESSKEGKILLNIIETLDDFAEAIVMMNEDQEDLTEYVEALDEDLADVEDELYETDESEDYEDDDIDFMEIDCPNCSEEIYVDEDLFYDETPEVVCPRCNKSIKLDEEFHCDQPGCQNHHHE